MKTKLSIIVPALNEEKRINQALKSITEEFKDAEVIVVSDGSTDKTTEIVRKYVKIKLIESEKTEGKGASIVKGFRAADGEVIGFLDADGSFKPKDVKELLKQLRGDVDCVVASKWVGKRFHEVGETTFRKISSRAWNMLLRALLGLDLCDTQAGAKFLKKKAFESIDTEYITAGFEYDVELLYRLKRKKYKIKEVYIPFEDVAESTFRYGKTPTMFLSLLRIWWNTK
ncbi:MAG: glycosyltransferase [Candidatus Altiarchaeota archaeon]|nr:glycosyltransferase [Candidatus Altiarchaeota archaeon]